MTTYTLTNGDNSQKFDMQASSHQDALIRRLHDTGTFTIESISQMNDSKYEYKVTDGKTTRYYKITEVNYNNKKGSK